MRSLLRLFDRPRAVLAAGSSPENTPTSGLVTVEMNLKAPAESDAVLRVFVGGATQPAVEKTVRLSPEGTRHGWRCTATCCARRKATSRRSIVGHYFARGSAVYYDSSGMPGVL
ncbi:MAG: hypothetical protein KGO51_02170 [Alphaproteobacteria bacterium]|nr:hypothetical protein [Alphaproteobacteria bacterium]